jgi:hypothetical protein
MQTGAETIVEAKPHTRFLAVCFALLLAAAMACGIGAAALADDFEDLNSRPQDSFVLVQEESLARTMPARNIDHAGADVVRGSLPDVALITGASAPRDDQVNFTLRNAGKPRAIHPTGPPLRA